MTNFKHVAAGAVFFALAGSAAFAAHSAGEYACQTWSPAKTGRTVTHCVTWIHEAAARMRAGSCDPATMSDAVMRAQCAAMMGDERSNGQAPAPAG
jgi:hypothetical protein